MPPDVMVTPEFVMCSSRIGEVSPCFAVVIYWMVGAVVCGEFSVYSTLWGMVEVDLVVAHSFAHVRWGQRQLELDFLRIMKDMYIVRPASRAHVVGPPPPAPAPPLDAPALMWMSHHRLRRHLHESDTLGRPSGKSTIRTTTLLHAPWRM